MNRETLNDEQAKSKGVSTQHEVLENGEARFRLINSDGNSYIRTEASAEGAWQNGHYHTHLFETYIVESGWMAIARLRDSEPDICIYYPNDVVTIEPTEAHNVYLPPKAVIHTVKHGAKGGGDWEPVSDLTTNTIDLSEEQILEDVRENSMKKDSIDPRFDAYMDLYNNLDNLLWRIPGFLVAGAAILIGLSGALLTKTDGSNMSPVIVAAISLLIGSLFLLSAYSMTRLRKHHTMAGDWLARMEPEGYFHKRTDTVAKGWPPSAQHVFSRAYYFLAGLFFLVAVLALVKYSWLTAIIGWQGF